MKTIEGIKSEISEVISSSKNVEEGGKEYKRLQKKVKRLNECLMCLEKLKTPERVTAELSMIESKIKLIDGGFTSWLRSTPPSDYSDSNARAHFEKEFSFRKMRRQVEILKYILS